MRCTQLNKRFTTFFNRIGVSNASHFVLVSDDIYIQGFQLRYEFGVVDSEARAIRRDKYLAGSCQLSGFSSQEVYIGDERGLEVRRYVRLRRKIPSEERGMPFSVAFLYQLRR